MTDLPTDNKVQLGCGTLIIIAIIVMLFSGGSDSKKLRGQLDDVNRKLDRLEKKIDELSQKVAQAPAVTPR
jgi:outer membrane murein-binding lipoprotein Lpp